MKGLPTFRSGPGQSPAWCELEQFEIIRLKPGQEHSAERVSPKEKLIVTSGQCVVVACERKMDAGERSQFELNLGEDSWKVEKVLQPTTIVRLCGHWGEELGGSGVFRAIRAQEPRDQGDTVTYPKETSFDRHYHDCDEYWIVVEGHGIAVSEDIHYGVQVGDCIATGRGFHHDFPIVLEPVTAVYFETTLEGLKRKGHLWEHTHGKAEPVIERR
ncbi:cupin domain-containing protein [Paenibacillus roseipurpureus]|uniref:Uncharacterized protein n=1 Tax=Paenibacillus roseopurpureus TaxID=2918901 RepID=A0AA96LJD0_9BACL|nr:hypothetical protein [Paenibacillus sp. MBLB1832]WNR42947.1 hypothetical protein MJB10_17720 [Paenibacillus sp. MBLB1832]